jgi:hypothetical protein
LVTAFLLALLAMHGDQRRDVQAASPEATVTVDRSRLRLGEELLLTVRVRSRVTPQPLRIIVPPLTGLATVGSRELTEVAVSPDGGPPVRITVRELRLRAERAGRRVIPSIRLEQGDKAVLLSPLSIEVDSGRTGLAEPLSPVARRLVEQVPLPESTSTVTVSLMAPTPVTVGSQVDLLAVVWFPRDLRLRLRRAPVLNLRTPDGVWAYPQSSPAAEDVAVSKLVRGHWMDLFVAHQVVFPLQPGKIDVLPVEVEFSLPVTYSFFSREDRYSLRSDPAVVHVRPLPESGRLRGDRGVVAEDLSLEVLVSEKQTRVGEPIEVTATASGIGNVALWPEPVLAWPAGFRAYPAQSVVRLEPRAGRTAGSKAFHYLVVPDSAGLFVLSERGYPYYDPSLAAYRVARAAPRPVAVALGAEPRAARALPPLLRPRPASWADYLGTRLWPWGWLLIALLPPLFAVLVRSRSATPAPARGPEPASDPFGSLEHDFHLLLASFVPDSGVREGPELAHALRATGIESGVAEHVMRLRDRLRAARYGPSPGGRGDGAALTSELREVLRFLDGERTGAGQGRRRARPGALVGVTLLLVLPGGLWIGQATTAEALYEAGALRAAADSFAARVELEPSVAAHWYNLGATLYRAGADGKAIAAWTRAARLAPRDQVIRRARALLPPPDPASDPLLKVGRASPAEWWLLAGMCWVLGWVVLLTTRRSVPSLVLAAIAVTVILPGAFEWRRRTRPVAVVLQPTTPVREAPYGSAATRATLDAGAALVLGRQYGSWVEVRRADGVHGWLLRSEVSRL